MNLAVRSLVATASFFGALAVVDAKPASREEALAACLNGCIKRIEEAGPVTPSRRAVCDETCGCIIDAMFESNGKRKRDPAELNATTAECIARLQAPPRDPPKPIDAFVRSPEGQPSIDLPLEVMTGHGCSKAEVPSLHFDAKQNVIGLDGGGFALRIPSGWRLASERPNLMLVWTTPRADGVRPVFEVFVTPKCKRVDALLASERVAARSLAGLAPAADIVKQVAKGKWKTGIGGPVGVSIILDVALKTPKGERHMVLYSTDLGDGKTFTVRAAAGCPREAANGQGLGPCEEIYFDMLKTSRR